MRVCLVSREFLPFYGAGIGAYALAMARAWARGGAGHETHVLTGRHAGVMEDGPRLCPGVVFHTVEPEGDGYDFERYARGVSRAVASMHAERPFDLIEFPDYWAEGFHAIRERRERGAFAGAVLAVRAHTPTEFARRLNGERTGWFAGRGVRTLMKMEWEAIAGADLLVSPTRSLLEWSVRAIERGEGAARKVRTRHAGQVRAVVPYAFDMAWAQGGQKQQATGGGPIVLYFGRLERRKGVELLVDAAGRLLGRGGDARFVFIGGDTMTGPRGVSMKEHLARRVAALGAGVSARIEFQPARPRAELAEAIGAATACCFPSVWENFPNTCLEAMALGAAVVGSDAGGMAEIIEDGVSGVLFRSGDVDSLVAAIERVLGDKGLSERIGAAAPGRVEELCAPGRVVREMERVVHGARPCRG